MTLTKQMVAGLVAFITTLAIVAAMVLVPAMDANATGGNTPANPIVVTNVADVPEGAVEDDPSTYETPNNKCDTTRSWVLTVEAQDEVSVTEYQFKKDIPAETETTPGLWLNFSPNREQGPFEGPPAYPTDPRGTWQHWGDYKDIPPGHAGPDGVYQQGNGNGSWFYRQAEKTTVVEEAYTLYYVLGGEPSKNVADASWVADAEVPGEPWVQFNEREVVVSEAVEGSVTYYAWTDGKVCEPETPTETPTPETPVVTPEVPVTTPEVPVTTPETPEEETPTPDKDKDEPVRNTPNQPQPPKDVQVIACVNGTWVTTVNGEVISESGTCAETSENSEFQTFTETGL